MGLTQKVGNAQLGGNFINAIIYIQLHREIPHVRLMVRRLFISSCMHDLAAMAFINQAQTDREYGSVVSFLPKHNSRAMVIIEPLPSAPLLGKSALWVNDIISPPTTSIVELVFACCSGSASTHLPVTVPFEIQIVS